MFVQIKCPHCGQLFDYDSSSGEPQADCPHCGTSSPVEPLDSKPPPLTVQHDAPTLAGVKPCPHCKAQIERDAVLCIHCGTNLATGEKAGGPNWLAAHKAIVIAMAAGIVVAAFLIAFLFRPEPPAPPVILPAQTEIPAVKPPPPPARLAKPADPAPAETPAEAPARPNPPRPRNPRPNRPRGTGRAAGRSRTRRLCRTEIRGGTGIPLPARYPRTALSDQRTGGTAPPQRHLEQRLPGGIRRHRHQPRGPAEHPRRRSPRAAGIARPAHPATPRPRIPRSLHPACHEHAPAGTRRGLCSPINALAPNSEREENSRQPTTNHTKYTNEDRGSVIHPILCAALWFIPAVDRNSHNYDT